MDDLDTREPMALTSADGATHEILEANCYSFQGFVTWCSVHGSSADRYDSTEEAYKRRADHRDAHDRGDGHAHDPIECGCELTPADAPEGPQPHVSLLDEA